MDDLQYAQYVAHEEGKQFLKDYKQSVDNEEYRRRTTTAMNQGFDSDYISLSEQDQNR